MDHNHDLSVVRQCKLLEVNRSSVYYCPKVLSRENEKLMRLIDEIYLEYPFKGSRRLRDVLLARHGLCVNRKRVARLMRLLGLAALHPGPRTTRKGKGHKIYPYLLGGMSIEGVNQVWATDVTYIPMSRGFVYLVAVMDWHSRKVLSWRVSNTMDVSFCVEALEEAIAKHGRPEIFNTDQGSQFTSEAFTGVLKRESIRISMDGKRSWMDNVFIERLWRSLKYEEVYLKAYDSVRSAKEGIGEWIDFYNTRRRHQGLDRSTPDLVYYGLPRGLPKVA